MTKQKEQENYNLETNLVKPSFLILHNDEINTFDFVIEALIDICEHDEVQAEQCALITHYKGKCDVKKGENKILESMKNLLLERGLSVTIEN